MGRHLREQHKEELTKAQELAKEDIAADTPPKLTPNQFKLQAMSKQLTLSDTLESRKIWHTDDPRSQAINEKNMLMIAWDNEPLDMVDNHKGFIALVAHLKPNYKIPGRKYFTETVLEDTYSKINSSMKREILPVHAEHISFTSDLWICKESKESFISLSGHWIDETYTPKTTCQMNRI